MGNHQLATPARVATGHVGLAVTVGVEQLGDLWLFEVGDVLDVVLVSGFLVDQVALGHARQDVASLDHHVVTTGLLVKLVVQFVPQVHGEVGIAVGQGHHHHAVLGLLRLLDLVAQLAQAFHGHFATEALFGDGGEDRRNLHALPRFFGRGVRAQRGCHQGQRSGAFEDAAGELGFVHRRLPSSDFYLQVRQIERLKSLAVLRRSCAALAVAPHHTGA
ncbi:hypothetical protein D3C78_398730 [compost metagenome]